MAKIETANRGATNSHDLLQAGNGDMTNCNSDSTPYVGSGEEFRAHIFSLCFKYTRSYHDALDLTQATYVKVLEHLDRGRTLPATSEGVQLYLEKIARNTHYDSGRTKNGCGKKKRARMIPFSSFERENESVLTDRLEKTEILKEHSENAREKWLRLLATNGGDQVVAVVTLKEQGYKPQDIASLLKVSVRTVRRRLHQAKEIVTRALPPEQRSRVIKPEPSGRSDRYIRQTRMAGRTCIRPKNSSKILFVRSATRHPFCYLEGEIKRRRRSRGW